LIGVAVVRTTTREVSTMTDKIGADEIGWFVGIDWASESHQVCLLDVSGQPVGARSVRHGGTGLGELCDWLAAKTAAAPASIGVAIEVPHGPVVEALLERGFQVYAVNPKQPDRFRDRFSVAGAKDDRRDAQVLANALRTDREALRGLSLDDPLVIELREWSRVTEDLQQERNRLTNRLREQLWRYYPQMLALGGDLAAAWMLELWRLAPTPAKAARLRQATVERLLRAHRIRRLEAATVLRILRQKPLAVAPGTVAAATAHIRLAVDRLELVNRQIKVAHRHLETLCDKLAAGEESEPGQATEQRDVTILRSMPGTGRIVIATLLAEAWQPLCRRDYHALRTLAGVAPVTLRSGKRCLVVRRYACNRRLANALYHWARVASQRDAVSRRRYAELRRRGHSHGRALRTIGDRLLAVACTLLQRQTLFDPNYTALPAAAA